MGRQNPSLVIMAEGMGSRFGGLKQIEPVDPEGHIIIDFSLFDAWRAGFRDVVFIIKREMEAEFRECIGDRMEQYFHVSYVYQDLDRLPEGIDYDDVPGLRIEAREKLKKIRPVSFGQAGRISGVSPADISVLMIYVESGERK